MYEARYRLTRRVLLLEGGCLLLLAAALLPMPWPIVVLDVGFFGVAALVIIAMPLSRGLAFRVDSAGVTLGWTFPRVRTSARFIPWDDVEELHLYELPYGRPPTPYIRVVWRAGDGYAAASRPIVAWTLDGDALLEVLANVAPHVPLTGCLPSTRKKTRQPGSPPEGKLWFVWCYLAPLCIAALVYLGTAHLSPAWSAHLGQGRVGTWTVVKTSCAGRSGCTPLGDFVASDGTDLRVHIQMAHGAPATPAAGGSLPAIDTGDPDRVYPIGGGYSWVVYALAALAACLLAPLWLWTVPVSGLRRRLRRRRG
ncbi:MAG TPA: hypothetical protein VFN97_05190 [Actinospica sp.]|nr:hypothetical protein [Actinospica sp.]